MSQEELTIYLIQEELKNRKFSNTLKGAGIVDCLYQADLSTAILDTLHRRQVRVNLYLLQRSN